MGLAVLGAVSGQDVLRGLTPNLALALGSVSSCTPMREQQLI
jgi:hypothetical protein